ncbi:MAG: YciI family protein [Anaerolineae bacterium]
MKEFLLVFRADYHNIPQDSPEEMQAMAKKWQDWIGGVAAQNKLIQTGKRLSFEGKVVRANNVITDGPYTEIKEAMGGYMLIKGDSVEEAIEIAKSCPILMIDGSVEIRGIV